MSNSDTYYQDLLREARLLAVRANRLVKLLDIDNHQQHIPVINQELLLISDSYVNIADILDDVRSQYRAEQTAPIKFHDA